jgi:hypothetical protein
MATIHHDGLLILNCFKECEIPLVMYNPSSCLQGMNNVIRNLSEESQSLGQGLDLNSSKD